MNYVKFEELYYHNDKNDSNIKLKNIIIIFYSK